MSEKKRRGWVALDTETTGLDASVHAPWEVAVVTEEGEEFAWELPVCLVQSDAYALSVGGYWERAEATRIPDPLASLPLAFLPDEASPIAYRTAHPTAGAGQMYAMDAIEEIHGVLLDRIVVCSNPHFDCKMLSPLFRAALLPDEPWYYHPADMKSIAWGALAAEGAVGGEGEYRLDSRSDDVIDAAVGTEGWSKQFDRHTALEDARWVAAFLRLMEERGGAPRYVIHDAPAD